jgi:hypothetical protein
MSIRVLQHLPGFVDGDPIDTTIEKLEDILELDFVDRWSKDYSLGVNKFDAIPKYGIEEYCYIYANVFDESTKTNQQWVVAFVYQPYDLVKEKLSGLKEFS